MHTVYYSWDFIEYIPNWTAPLSNPLVQPIGGSSVFSFSVCLSVYLSVDHVFGTPKYGHVEGEGVCVWVALIIIYFNFGIVLSFRAPIIFDF